LGTPVGTPPNLIGIAMLERFAKVKISFLQWMAIGIPIFLVGYVAVLILLKFLYPLRMKKDETPADIPAKTPFTIAQKTCLLVFGITVLLWLVPGFTALLLTDDSAIKSFFSTSIPEAAAAMIGAILLFIVPASTGEGKKTARLGKRPEDRLGNADPFRRRDGVGSMMFETKLAQFFGEKWLLMFGNPPSGN